MIPRRPRLAALALLGLVPLLISAAEPEISEKDLPRVPPTEPGNVISTFEIRKGFQIQLVAAEPLVFDPIAMAFDEDGRLFIVEMRDYAERRNEHPHGGRIRMLEDTDGDGRFDKSTVYVDNLPWPTAVICWQGGIFVGSTPDILYCKDTNGDGVADVRERVFTGFASSYAPYDVNKLNVQALFNGFTWSLDNRIHGANGGDSGRVRLIDSEFTRAWRKKAGVDQDAGAGQILDLGHKDFSFDPRTLQMRLESGGGQYGLTFDDRGRKFVCSNSAHIRQVMYEDRYAERNPFFTMPAPALDIAEDGPAAPIFRISPDEPWRVIRTRWRVAGLFPGPIEGGGRPSGYFSAATGITIYRGNAFPQEFRGDAFIADCGANLVHRKKLFPDGVALVARRAPDEQKTEFLASRDNWFRPVQLANAPDGTLYVADMYREIIEHPWSLPASMRKLLDLNSGNDRGRVYRIVPDGFKQPRLPHWSAASTSDLVSFLRHANGWDRDTAARLLYERQDQSAIPLLRELLRDPQSDLGRLHAFYALEGLSALTQQDLLGALGDKDGAVREHALRLEGNYLAGQPRANAASAESTASQSKAENNWSAGSSNLDQRIWRKLVSLANDPDPGVRYQLAFTLGIHGGPGRLEALTEIVRSEPGDRWLRAAVLNSLKEDGVTAFQKLADEHSFSTSAAGRRFLEELAGVIGMKGDAAGVRTVLEQISTERPSEASFSFALALGEGLRSGGGSLAKAEPSGALNRIYDRAQAAALDGGAAEQTRVRATELLGLADFGQTGAALARLLNPNEPEAVQSAAVSALARSHAPQVREILLRHWAGLNARVRDEILGAMMMRPERIRALLEAVERNIVLPSSFTARQLQTLRAYRDPEIRERAAKLLGTPPDAKRDQVIEAFLPALELRGDPAKGERIYLERCATCHRIGNQGHAVGPDLVTVKSAGKETLLVNILDPNREVLPRYLNYTADTKSGDEVSGLIVNESSSSITLRGPNGVETTLTRSQIAQLQPSSLSLMPEGLEAGLTPQDLANLLEYVTSAK